LKIKKLSLDALEADLSRFSLLSDEMEIRSLVKARNTSFRPVQKKIFHFNAFVSSTQLATPHSLPTQPRATTIPSRLIRLCLLGARYTLALDKQRRNNPRPKSLNHNVLGK
jgi:hypothetical protein